MKQYVLVTFVTLFLCIYASSNVALGEATSTGSKSPVGSGTLELAGKTYEFDVLQCNFSGDSDPEETRTLYGRGKTPDEEDFSIFADRNKIRGILMHSINIQISRPKGKSTYYEASRGSSGNMWIDEHGAAEGPLIVIDGPNLKASGAFTLGPSNEVVGNGTLKATCKE
jgi:hypothetical protein